MVTTSAPPASILIVDDDEAVTQTFARMLRLEGFAVRTAVDADAGLLEARNSRPNAIIVDMRMPMVDGLGFLRALRAQQGHSVQPIPVAIVTGDCFLDEQVSLELRDLGAHVAFKPLWFDDLLSLARTLTKVTS